MSDFEKWADEDDGWDHNTGAPSLSKFSDALQVWSAMQDPSDTTVAEAAAVFKVTPQQIVEAVEQHPWMYLEGPDDAFDKLVIQHEGE